MSDLDNSLCEIVFDSFEKSNISKAGQSANGSVMYVPDTDDESHDSQDIPNINDSSCSSASYVEESIVINDVSPKEISKYKKSECEREGISSSTPFSSPAFLNWRNATSNKAKSKANDVSDITSNASTSLQCNKDISDSDDDDDSLSKDTSQNDSVYVGHKVHRKQNFTRRVILSDSESDSDVPLNHDEQSFVSKSPISKKITSNCSSNTINDCSVSQNINSSSKEYTNTFSERDNSNINDSTESTKLYNGKYKIKKRSQQLNYSNVSTSSSLNGTDTSISSIKSVDLRRMSESEIKDKIKSHKVILKTANIDVLPDKGMKIKNKIKMLEEALQNLEINKIEELKDDSSDVISSSNESENLSPKQSNEPVSKPMPVLSELDVLKKQLEDKKMVYKATNLRVLPDGGQKLKDSISKLERQIMMLNFKAQMKISSGNSESKLTQSTLAPQNDKVLNRQIQLINGLGASDLNKAIESSQKAKKPFSQGQLNMLYRAHDNVGGRDYGGKLSSANTQNMLQLTSDAVNFLHQSMKSMPDVDTEEEMDPEGIKVQLMPHQKRGLKWLLWRESQMPPGGILADDMGLGKTLLILSLILRHRELVEAGQIEEDHIGNKKDTDWLSKDALVSSKGTLIVCPASLLGQWEGEIGKRLSKRKLSNFVYHGTNRDISAKRLAQFDVVITTYNLMANEAFSKSSKVQSKGDEVPQIASREQGLIYRIGWTRVVLDEAHVIRNHKTKAAQAACMLRAGRRWVVTGTPVQNKDMDLYSLIRFLRVSPFDDYTCWKHQIKGSTINAMQKLNLIVKTVLLRRTKDQIDKLTGQALVQLPDKQVIEHSFELTQDERTIYDRVFAFSRKSLIEYMKSQDEKEMEKAKKLGQSFKPQMAFSDNDYKYTPTLPGELFKQDMKAHHMLVLLLRLRQICCHPALIRAIIEDDSKKADGLDVENKAEEDLINQLGSLGLAEKEGASESLEESKEDIPDEVLTMSNPIFKKRFCSSKIEKVMEELQCLESEDYDKAVIVSQWTSMLDILYKHLMKSGYRVAEITGNVPIKDRAAVVEEFNRKGKGPQILLLSLVAGGVGLNLVGANHLFLLDMHWNPQLESQACDRIYRVGQLKNVKVHRFVVKNTVEEKILELQQKKIELADSLLTGAKRTGGAKLTLQDIKALFSIA